MARKPRIHYPGVLYHVIVKGNAGNPIFFDDVDRCRFCFLLQEGIERFGHRIHAFSLLSNHAHMAIQVQDVPLSRIVQNFSFRHSQWINTHHAQSGHVLQGRYKARIVDADTYLMQLVRYINLNPVRAGLVIEPDDYYWGSFGAYVGTTQIPWLTTEWILSLLGEDEHTARLAYGRFVNEGWGKHHDPDVFDKWRGRILGDEQFTEEAYRKANEVLHSPVSIEDVIAGVCKIYGISVQSLATGSSDRMISEARGLVSWGVRELSEEHLSKLTTRLQRDISTLSVAAKRITRKMETDEHILKKVEMLKAYLGRF